MPSLEESYSLWYERVDSVIPKKYIIFKNEPYGL